MIICKERGTQEIVLINNSHKSYQGNYSLICQNTTTKEVTVYDVTDNGSKLYHKFTVDIQLEDGEYIVLLFENTEHLPFYASINDITAINYFKYLSEDGKPITHNTFFLVLGDKEERIQYTSSTIMRIGEYKKPNKTYKREQGYFQYNK